MALYKYDSPDAGTLDDQYEAADGRLQKLTVALEPGQEFDAPDDWAPYPNPHPVFKLVTPVTSVTSKSAPDAAPLQE